MTDYYVATDGSDSNPGTLDEPLATLHEAASNLEAGDTAYLRGGVYSHQNGNPVHFNGVSGTESDPITIIGYQNETPVLEWEGGSNGGLWGGGGIEMERCEHFHIKNLHIRKSSDAGIIAEHGRGHVFENLETYENGNSGCETQRTDDVRFSNVRSYDNSDIESDDGEDADGVVFAFGDGGLIENCVALRNSDDGYDLWESINTTVDKCVAANNGDGSDGDGNGIKMGGTRPGGAGDGHDGSWNNTVTRSIAYGNRNDGITFNTAEDCIVYNNTSYDNGRYGYVFRDHAHVVKNNIGWANSNDDGLVDGDGAVIEANSWQLGSPDPEFVSTDPDSPDFLRLSDSSPFVDAGVDVGLPFNGEAPDLGAYESGGTTTDGSTSDSTSGGTKVNDGSGWRSVTVYYHDGDSFQSA